MDAVLPRARPALWRAAEKMDTHSEHLFSREGGFTGGRQACRQGAVESCSLRVMLCQVDEAPGDRSQHYRPAQ